MISIKHTERKSLDINIIYFIVHINYFTDAYEASDALLRGNYLDKRGRT